MLTVSFRCARRRKVNKMSTCTLCRLTLRIVQIALRERDGEIEQKHIDVRWTQIRSVHRKEYDRF